MRPEVGDAYSKVGDVYPKAWDRTGSLSLSFYNEYFRSLLSVSCNSIASVCQAGNLYPVARLPFSGRSHSSFVEGSQKELGR